MLKGQADIIYLTGMLFIVVIALFAVDMIWHGFQTNQTSQQLFNATPQGQLAQKNANTSINILNNAVVILYVAGAIASIIAAAFSDSSAVFIVPAMVILPIEVLFAFIFHDAFFTIVEQSSLGTVASGYPLILTLFQYLPMVSFGFAVILIIVTFIS
jgi:hypothetical protein